MEIKSSSPPPASRLADNGPASSDLIIRLLTEIRDAQLESLEMLRESTLKQKKLTRTTIPFMIVTFLIGGLIVPLYIFYSAYLRTRSIAPLPTRPPIVAPR